MSFTVIMIEQAGNGTIPAHTLAEKFPTVDHARAAGRSEMAFLRRQDVHMGFQVHDSAGESVLTVQPQGDE